MKWWWNPEVTNNWLRWRKVMTWGGWVQATEWPLHYKKGAVRISLYQKSSKKELLYLTPIPIPIPISLSLSLSLSLPPSPIPCSLSLFSFFLYLISVSLSLPPLSLSLSFSLSNRAISRSLSVYLKHLNFVISLCLSFLLFSASFFLFTIDLTHGY